MADSASRRILILQALEGGKLMMKANHRKHATHRKAAHAHHAAKPHARRAGARTPSMEKTSAGSKPESDSTGDEAAAQAQARVREDDSEDDADIVIVETEEIG
jgi:hypothetical protein